MNQMKKSFSLLKGSEPNDSEFRLIVDPVIPQADVDALVSFLEQSMQQGTRFGDGQTIDFGSMIFRIVSSGDFLTLEEPDLVAFPISWKTGITQSMKLMRLQKDVAESVGLGNMLDFPSIRNSLLVGADLTEGANSLILDRAGAEGSDSGWFVGKLDTQCDYNDAANLTRISVYKAILSWPSIAGFLALPCGSRVETLPLQISRNGDPLEIRKGTFLDVARI